MKIAAIFLICLTTLLLLLYPFVLMANIMAVSSFGAGTPPPRSFELAFYVWAWGSSLYPLPWLVALAASILNLRRGNPPRALLWQGLLSAYVLVLAVLVLSFFF